jgi:hypothetical protein
MDQFAEITSLLAKYARGNDTNNVPMIGECFTEDAVFELVISGSNQAPLIFNGRGEIEGLMSSSMESQGDIRRHFSTNLQILSLEEKSARTSSYLLLGVSEHNGLRIVQSGLYEDLIVWGPSGAQFARRNLTMDGVFA